MAFKLIDFIFTSLRNLVLFSKKGVKAPDKIFSIFFFFTANSFECDGRRPLEFFLLI